MLTPSFNVSQTEAIVTITIRVRYVKVSCVYNFTLSTLAPLLLITPSSLQISEAEIYLHDSTFKFYCNPYFLHLELPGQLAEDGLEKTSYDADTGGDSLGVKVHTALRGYITMCRDIDSASVQMSSWRTLC